MILTQDCLQECIFTLYKGIFEIRCLGCFPLSRVGAGGLQDERRAAAFSREQLCFCLALVHKAAACLMS